MVFNLTCTMTKKADAHNYSGSYLLLNEIISSSVTDHYIHFQRTDGNNL